MAEAEAEAENGATMTPSTPSAANGAGVQAEGKKARRPPVPMAEREKAVYVNVVRDPEIQAARMNLPIIGEEQVGGVLHPAWVQGLGGGGCAFPSDVTVQKDHVCADKSIQNTQTESMSVSCY
jgi:hypothetical protein